VSQQETIPVKNLAFGLGIAFSVLAIFIFMVFIITRLGLDDHHDEAHAQPHNVSQEERIKPVGQVRLEGESEPIISVAAEKTPTPAVESASSPKSGQEIFDSVCFACHKDGILGSPKLGDKAVWTERLAKGEATVVQNAIKGIFQMPPRGGNADLSDEDIKKSVQYMLAQAGLFEETDTAETAPKTEETAPKAEEKSTSEPTMLDAVGVNTTSPQSDDAIETTTTTEETAPTEESATTTSTDLDLAKGEQIYGTACALCHVAGVAGAPKFGDKDSWAPRIAQGMETLFSHALNGFQAMPPKGGFVQLPDEDIKAAVAYMVSQGQ
jgi:cytochrome c5